MIQRIQSLYLIFIIILSLLLLSGGIYNFRDESGNAVRLLSSGILTEQNQKMPAHVAPPWVFTSMLTAICVISIGALLMFRKRSIQMLLTGSVIVLSALLIGVSAWFVFSVMQDLKMTFSPGIKMVFPLLILIFSILALRGIQKDNRLVKSYDRLR